MSSKIAIATHDLKIGADIAYQRGAEVSEEALKQSDKHGWGWRDLSVGEDTKTAAKVKEEEAALLLPTPADEEPPKKEAASKSYESAAPVAKTTAKADDPGKDN